MTLTEKAYLKAIEAIEKCSTPHGLYASGGKEGYNSVWSRDSMICLLGAALVKNDKFKKVLSKTIETLSIHQSKRGQIPNCVDIYDKKRRKQVTFATMDSTLWYLIGQEYFSKAFKDKKLKNKFKRNIQAGFNWVGYQDAGEEKLPEQQPTSDWQDCFPHKYGHVLNSQALYYGALKIHGMNKSAEKVKHIINGYERKDLMMYSKRKGYYLPWIWKDHDGIREQEDWFDSSGNLLSIIFGLTEKKRANSIINYIKRKKINKPYPVKAMFPPIEIHSSEWKDYFSKCIANEPYSYINGGIWPYIGGLYVVALVAVGKIKEAEIELDQLAKTNLLGKEHAWEFNEWIHPITGKASGSDYHAWSAGAYIFAYHAVKQKQVPLIKTKY